MNVFRISPYSRTARILSIVFIAIMCVLVVGRVRAELINNQISEHPIKGDFLITPDGKTVVYKSEFNRLYSASIEGGSVTEIGFFSGEVEDFALTPDGNQVVFKQIIDGQTQLYSVPVLGGEPIQLNGDLIQEGHVFQFQISPDSATVLYLADQETNDLEELYIAPLLGGEWVKLNHPLNAVGGPDQFDSIQNQQFSPDSQTVVFVVRSPNDQTHNLFSVPAAGGDSIRLNLPVLSPVGTFEFFMEFAISPDSQHVLYLADQDTADQYELYQVPISGGEQIKLNGTLSENGDVEWVSYAADGKFILYISNPEGGNKYELYSKSTASGNTVQLTTPATLLIDIPQISESGDWLVYRGYIEEIESYALFSSPLAFENHTQLTPNPTTEESDDSQNSYFGFQISADGNTVVYHSDHEVEDMFQLYSVPLKGGESVRLNGLLVDEGDVTNDQLPALGQFLISPDSKRVVYIADQDTDDTFELFSTPIKGGPVTKLNGPLSQLGDVGGENSAHFKFSPDSSRVVFVADQDLDDHLYASLITPLFTSEPNRVALLDLPYSYMITAEDVDQTAALHITADDLPAWLTLTDHGDGTATLAGRPTADGQRAYEIRIQVTNGNGLIDTQTFTLDVGSIDQTLYMPVVQTGE